MPSQNIQNRRSFHPTIWVLFTAFITGFSGAMMPGPMLAAVVNHGLLLGFVAAPLVVLGHALVEFPICLALGKGLARILTHPKVFVLIAVSGGVMLILMGWDMIVVANGEGGGISEGLFEKSRAMDEHSSFQALLAGVVTSIGNPYFVIWWATVGLALLQEAREQKVSPSIFFCGHILSDIAWYGLIGILIGSGRNYLNPMVLSGIMMICGGILIILGILFLIKGISHFRRT